MRSATRVDDIVIFVGGYSRRLTRRERLLIWLANKMQDWAKVRP